LYDFGGQCLPAEHRATGEGQSGCQSIHLHGSLRQSPSEATEITARS